MKLFFTRPSEKMLWISIVFFWFCIIFVAQVIVKHPRLRPSRADSSVIHVCKWDRGQGFRPTNEPLHRLFLCSSALFYVGEKVEDRLDWLTNTLNDADSNTNTAEQHINIFTYITIDSHLCNIFTRRAVQLFA